MEDQKYDIGAGVGPGTTSAMLGMHPDNLGADSAMGLGPSSHQASHTASQPCCIDESYDWVAGK